MGARNRTDWAAVKLAYVNTSSKSLRDVAVDFSINPAGVMRRAAKEGWEAERKRKSAEVSVVAQSKITETRAQMLEQFNKADITVAKGLRSRAANLMTRTDSAADLRAIAATFETAQRIGRLALGASTEKQEVDATVKRTLDDMTDEELAQEAARHGLKF